MFYIPSLHASINTAYPITQHNKILLPSAEKNIFHSTELQHKFNSHTISGQHIASNKLNEIFFILGNTTEELLDDELYDKNKLSLMMLSSGARNNWEKVKELIDHGANVNYRHPQSGMTILMFAARHGDITTLRYIINKKADINAKNNRGQNALYFSYFNTNRNEEKIIELAKLFIENKIDLQSKSAGQAVIYSIERDMTDFFNLLIGNDANINYIDQNNLTATNIAVKMNKATILEKLLEHGGNINTANASGSSPFIQAVSSKKPSLVKLFLKHHPDINSYKYKKNNNPLLLSVKNKSKEIVRILLDAGIDPNPRDTIRNMTPLLISLDNKSYEITEILLNNGGNPNLESNNGYNPASYILTNREPPHNVIKLLIDKGADPNTIIHNDESFLSALIIRKYEGLAKLLIQKGANVLHKNKRGNTALVHLIFMKNHKLAEYLIQHGAAKGKYGEQALLLSLTIHENPTTVKYLLNSGLKYSDLGDDVYEAFTATAYTGNIVILKLILESGIDINHKNRNGNTALMLAAENGQMNIIPYLIEKGARLSIKNKFNMTALMFALDHGFLYVNNRNLIVMNNYYSNKINLTSGKKPTQPISHRYRKLTLNMRTPESRNDMEKSSGIPIPIDILRRGTYDPYMLKRNTNHIKIIESLIKLGADINIQDSYMGWSPLMQAAYFGNTKAVKLLLKSGANSQLKNILGNTALDLAIQERKYGVINILEKL